MKNLSTYLNEKEHLKGGIGDETDIKDINKKELEMGIEVEMEHTNDLELAKEIAIDHLTEIPDYYTRLQDMEQDADIDTISIDVQLDIEDLDESTQNYIFERMRKPRKREINSAKVTRVATENLFGKEGTARPMANKIFKLFKREIRETAKKLNVPISQVKQFKITLRDYDDPGYEKSNK